MNKKASYIDVQRILNDLDSIPVRDYRIYIEQFEESQWSLGPKFFEESRYHWRYANALYEIGEHKKFIGECDMAMLYLLNHSDWEDKMDSKYRDILFHKAIAHTRMKQFDKAGECCKQLKALNFDKRKIKFLKRHILESEARSLFTLLDNEWFYIALLAGLSTSLAYLIFSKLL